MATKIDKETFCIIKRLLEKGAKQVDLSKTFDVNVSTISRINNAETHEKYILSIRERNAKYCPAKPNNEPEKQTEEQKECKDSRIGTLTFLYHMNRIYAELLKQTELLERMVEQWKA